MENNEKKAIEIIETYQGIFGKENFYLEMQHHPEIANWSIVNSKVTANISNSDFHMNQIFGGNFYLDFRNT